MAGRWSRSGSSGDGSERRQGSGATAPTSGGASTVRLRVCPLAVGSGTPLPPTGAAAGHHRSVWIGPDRACGGDGRARLVTGFPPVSDVEAATRLRCVSAVIRGGLSSSGVAEESVRGLSSATSSGRPGHLLTPPAGSRLGRGSAGRLEVVQHAPSSSTASGSRPDPVCSQDVRCFHSTLVLGIHRRSRSVPARRRQRHRSGRLRPSAARGRP